MFRTIATLLTAFAFAGPAPGDTYRVGDIAIGDPVIIKAFSAARAAGGYMSLTNTGDQPDALIGVRTESYGAMIHESGEEDGVMLMILRERVGIPAGETVSFRPGGFHVMFVGLARGDLSVGETLDASLVFERAGEVSVTFTVEDLQLSDTRDDEARQRDETD